MTTKRSPIAGIGHRGGFTLIELVLTTAITTIVMGALASVMVIASRGMERGWVADSAVASQAVQEICEDMSLAEEIRDRTAHSVTLRTPDRTGDGVDEWIRYSWSGTPGDPLLRSINDSAESVVADNVHWFDLDFFLGTPGSGS